MAAPSFSAVVVTLNEENYIRACLEHLTWCEERILVDMHSQDATREQARDLATTILLQDLIPHMEFARNRGIDAARGDWILVVDADEIIPPGLASCLREHAARGEDLAGIWIPRMGYIFGQPVRHVGGFPDYQLRAFRRGAGFYPDRLHSGAQVTGRTIFLPVEDGVWIHHERKDARISDYVRKWDTYAEKEARAYVAQGKRFEGPMAMLWIPLSAFRFRFFTNQGYRDGMVGLVLSVLFAFYRFEFEAKRWEAEGYAARWDEVVGRIRSWPVLLWALAVEAVRRLLKPGGRPGEPSGTQ